MELEAGRLKTDSFREAKKEISIPKRGKRKGGEMNKRNIFSMLSFLLFALSSFFIFGQTPAPTKEPKQVKIIFPNGSLRCEPSRGSVAFYATSTHPEPFYVGGGNEWEVMLSSAGIYHLRQTSWGNNFWEVDLMKRQILKISEGAGLTRKPSLPLGFEVVILRPGEMAFAINFRKMELKFEPLKGQIKLYGESSLLSNCSDLDQCKINPQLYHLKNRMLTGGSFWKIDLGAKQLIYTTGGNFCEISENDSDSIWSGVQIDIKY
jgi:hypothetical protein